jgi:hypothetical protein
MPAVNIRFIYFFIWMAVFGMVAGTLQAEIPHKINYQGKLIDSVTGDPKTGSHNMVFGIYDDPESGTLLWSESQTVQADSAGIFSAMLGSITPIDALFDGPVWLEVEVEGEILAPRREVVSAPFAFRAEVADHSLSADSLGGHSLDDFVLEGETSVITSVMIVGGSGSGLDADMLDGLNADAFADTGHAHDDSYWPRDSLSTPGIINQGSNPVDWARLKNVPAGFADGSDDGGVGDGHSLDAMDGNPTDAVYVDANGHVGIGSTSPLPGRLVVTDSSITVFAQTWDGTAINAVALGGTALSGYADDGYAAYLSGQVFMSGDVGIGTLTPERKLHLLGDNPRILIDAATSNPEINFRNAEDAYSEMWALYKDEGTDDLRLFQAGDKVTFEGTTGNVGVGTENPISKLDVAGAINTSTHYKIAGDTVLAIPGTDNTFVGGGAGANSTSNSNTFVGRDAGRDNTSHENTFVGVDAGCDNTGERNTFIGNGAGWSNTSGKGNTFVGMGSGWRSVTGDHNVFVGLGAGQENDAGEHNTCVGTFAGSWSDGGQNNTYVGYDAGSYNAHGSSNVFIGSGAGTYEPGSEKLYIANGADSSDVLIYGEFDTGNLGLGTLIPEEKLHIVGDNPRILIEAETSNPEINFKSSGDASTEVWALYKDDSNSDLYFYQNDDIRLALKNGTGNVGIGTHNTGSYKLYVQGEAYSTVNWTSSDRRFKREISGIDDALDRVLGLRGVVFRWKTEEYTDRGFPEGEHFGVISQETREVLPEIVKEGPDGEESVAYSEIIPILIESIRELRAENEALKERVAALEASRD